MRINLVINSEKYFGGKIEIEQKLNRDMNILLVNCPPLKSEEITLTFSDNFTMDIIQFQINNSIQERGHSEGAKGKAFHIIDGSGIKKNYVFLELDYFSKVFQETMDECYPALILIIHEIGHIYDGEYVDNLFPENFEGFGGMTRLQTALYGISKITWLEFKANDFAAKSLFAFRSDLYNKFGEVISIFIPGLLKVIAELNIRIEKARREVLETDECVEIQNLTRDLFYYYAQVFGMLNGAKDFYEECKPEI